MTLRLLVAQDKWQEFDAAWSELSGSDGPVDDLVSALELVGKKKRIPRCLMLLKEHSSKLQEAGRAGDSARVLGAALLAGASPADVGTALLEAAEKAWGKEPWYLSYTTETGFGPGATNLRKAWNAFETSRLLAVGTAVYHAGGWGTGEILAIDSDKRTVEVRFASGKRDVFPMSAAVDIFQVLPADDLRSQHLRDPEALAKRLKEQPLEVLRTVVERANGSASTVTLRNALLQVGVEGTAWTGWWRKTRKLAENSEWFRVTGSGTKLEVHLLTQATDPVQDLKRQLSGITTLEDMLSRARELFVGDKISPDLKQLTIDTLLERARVPEPGTPEYADAAGWRLAAWIFAFEHSGKAPAELVSACEAALAEKEQFDDEETTAPPLWALFQTVPTLREQERCADVLKLVLGEERWLDDAAFNLQHAPGGMVKPLIDALSAAGRKDVLIEHYRVLLTRPLRAPHLLVALARLAEGGKLKGELPSSFTRAQALLSLATNLYLYRRRDAATGRVHTRVVELLTKGRQPLLSKMLADSDYDALRRAPAPAPAPFAARAAPLPTASEANRFWETNSVWTTRRGLQKRQAELRLILEEKIPAAETAIGRAASFGDLSENAEWTAAVEERRNLSEMVDQMQRELQRVDLIDTAARDEDTVTPGAYVRFRDKVSREEQRILILGPWDTDSGEEIVSYRAPLAAGLLGLKKGDLARVELPGGAKEPEILEVAQAELKVLASA